MNIFYLDLNPWKAAQYHNDKHVVKMVLETAQLLSSTHWVTGLPSSTLGGYEFLKQLPKLTHKNHPMAIWARQNTTNYYWLYSLFVGLCREYTFRYEKHHSYERLIPLLLNFPNIPIDSKVDPPLCMPEDCRVEKLRIIPGTSINPMTTGYDPVASYRNYYIKCKQHIAKWTKREIPSWYVLEKV